MPLIIKDYKWEESDKMVYITVPLKGVKSSKVDIFSTEEYVKASYPPYVFECFLNAPVVDKKSVVQLGDGAVVFKLEKLEAALWERLQHPNSDDKQWQKESRENAVERSQKRCEEEKQEKLKIKDELKRVGINEQLSIEQADRGRIEKVKQDERDRTMNELQLWQEQQKKLAEETKQKEEEERKQQEEARKAQLKEERAKARKKKSNIFEKEAGGAPVRQLQTITFSHTPRVFPTPMRESSTPNEEEWLKKQADAKRIVEISDSDLTEQEKNPQYLKEKADKFFQSGDLHSAINAYSTAIRFNPKLPSLYSNRAACHLKLNNLMKCAEDSDSALKLLTPPVPANASSRVRAHVRRGTALVGLELYAEGLSDYEAALKIEPDNEQVRADAEKVRQVIQSSDGGTSAWPTQDNEPFDTRSAMVKHIGPDSL